MVLLESVFLLFQSYPSRIKSWFLLVGNVGAQRNFSLPKQDCAMALDPPALGAAAWGLGSQASSHLFLSHTLSCVVIAHVLCDVEREGKRCLRLCCPQTQY